MIEMRYIDENALLGSGFALKDRGMAGNVAQSVKSQVQSPEHKTHIKKETWTCLWSRCCGGRDRPVSGALWPATLVKLASFWPMRDRFSEHQSGQWQKNNTKVVPGLCVRVHTWGSVLLLTCTHIHSHTLYRLEPNGSISRVALTGLTACQDKSRSGGRCFLVELYSSLTIRAWEKLLNLPSVFPHLDNGENSTHLLHFAEQLQKGSVCSQVLHQMKDFLDKASSIPEELWWQVL